MNDFEQHLIVLIRQEVRHKLQRKTGWGRNEVMQVVEQALTDALMQYIQERKELFGE